MKNLADKVKKTIGAGLVGAILAGTPGCGTMTPAQKTALVGNALTILGSTNLPGSNTIEGERAKEILKASGNVVSNQAQMKANLEYANAGKTDITVNNNPNSKDNYNESKLSNFDMVEALLTNEKELELSQTSNLDNPFKPNAYFIVARNYVDFNRNGLVGYSEFIDASKYAYVVSKSNPLKFYLIRETSVYSNRITNIAIYDLLENGKEVKNSPATTLGKAPLKEIILNDEYFPKTSNYRVVLNIEGKKSLFLDVAVVTEKDYKELSESNKE
ncbi:MAG TPA: hypothetical protein PK357_00835 [Candidatus Pacearchaeota archaeon]|nr:hypothetical protein [Candidatus Pacearchaeota archaeon]